MPILFSEKMSENFECLQKMMQAMYERAEPIFESPNPPLLTAKRYKGWHMSLCLLSSIQKVNFTSTFFSHHRDFSLRL